ncbi:MAG: ABC transporter permease subunit [Acidobacteriota bacterium]
MTEGTDVATIAAMRSFRFSPAITRRPALTLGDGVVILSLVALVYVGVRLSFHAPAVISGPRISLSFGALPWYALLSTGRMLLAYLLSLLFTLTYGYAAARNRTAEKILMPVLDILQSVPILSFLPVVLLSLTVILPEMLATELAAIVLIFTSQAWNMTYSFYQSISTIPTELREASAIFRLDPWLRFKTAEVPFSALGLIWNSMMSWAGGWFFLMASEMFTIGSRDFRLPGIGAYLQTAAGTGNIRAVTAGLITLVLVITLLDQFLWRPILAWAEKFKVEMVAGDNPPQSWFRHIMARSWLVHRFTDRVVTPAMEWIDSGMRRRWANRHSIQQLYAEKPPSRSLWVLGVVVGTLGLYGTYRAGLMLRQLHAGDWAGIGLGTLATLLRVSAALLIAVAWTVPVGVAIGANRKLASILQPIVQVTASVPATALFPVILLALVRAPGGLNIAAVLLMLLGTQWYLLFNVIAGTMAMPKDLRDTTSLLRLARGDRWRTLILPSLFPYLVTGAITATGGAWNASIIAEHAQFGSRSLATTGIGATIAAATGRGDYPLLLASTLALIATVVTINRFFWRWLYRVAEERYRME